MEEHSREKAERLNLIRKGKVIPHQVEEFVSPAIPLSHTKCVPPKQAKNTKKSKKTGKRKRMK